MSNNNVARAEEVLGKWQKAIGMWRDQPSSPELCHPWSEADFERRKATFAGAGEKFDSYQITTLAAEGFEYDEASAGIVCKLCLVKAQDQFVRSHSTHCPWKGRPFATLRLERQEVVKPEDSIYNKTRAALQTLERIDNVMTTMRRT